MPTPPDPLGVQTLATIVRGVLLLAAFGPARERMRAAGSDPAVTPFTEIVAGGPTA